MIAIVALCAVLLGAAHTQAEPNPEAQRAADGPMAPETDWVQSQCTPNTQPIAPVASRPVIPAEGRMTWAAWVSPEQRLHRRRVWECRRIVAELYPWSGFLPYCEVLVSVHERMEREGGPAAAGYGAAWFWSIVYGGANFSLQVGGIAPGNCAGPMDVKHSPRVLDPVQNIEWHCREMLGFWKRGVRGRDLCEHVFLPANPRDWGGGRFRRTEARCRKALEETQ